MALSQLVLVPSRAFRSRRDWIQEMWSKRIGDVFEFRAEMTGVSCSKFGKTPAFDV